MTVHRSALTASLVPVLLFALAGCSTAANDPQPATTQIAAAPTAVAAAPPTQTQAVPAPAATNAPAQPAAVPTSAPTGPPSAAPATQPAAPLPNNNAVAPTLVRTQGAVQIFNGTSPTPLASSTDRAVGASAVQLEAAPGAGSAVTDAAGFSLYRFDKDTANPSATSCVGDCALKWPPLLVGTPASVYTKNVDAQLVGYVERPDGTCQVTIGGWPVYYFANDLKPGESLGQGVGGTWFAIDGQGKKTTTVATPSSGGTY
jgi:predicted lipoprotein with Yx(FWY)xxD motif